MKSATEMQDSLLNKRHKDLASPIVEPRQISTTMKKIFEKINFKQPKYMLPAILYIPLLAASYFIFDLFNTGKAEIPDKSTPDNGISEP
jgi:hypothetical protein